MNTTLYIGTTNDPNLFHIGMTKRFPKERWKDSDYSKLPYIPEPVAFYNIGNISDYDVSVNVTLVFNTAQAILCAKAGADYVSPFVGRVDDNGFSGLGLISDIASTFKQFRDNGNWFDAKILSASLRDAKSVADCFRVGSDVVTMPPAVFDKMYDSVLTREGLALFQKDWDSVSKG